MQGLLLELNMITHRICLNYIINLPSNVPNLLLMELNVSNID